MKSEQSALLLSAIAALVLGVVGLVFALFTGSQAILLDGLFNLSYFVTALFTLRVARLVARPDDDQYPFGYGYFEPLINAVKGLLMLGISLLALFDALVALFSGGREIVIGPAIGYAVFATLGCIVCALLLRRSRHINGSPLVAADCENWTVNGAISAAVLLAFCAIPILQSQQWHGIVPYVDPALVALVILISIGVPIRMAWRALLSLLNKAPPLAVQEPVIAAIHRELSELPTRKIYVRMVQPGRMLYIAVHLLLPERHEPLSIDEMDAFRHRLRTALLKLHARIVVDMVFTAEEEFAAPSVGFVVAAPSS